MWDQVYDVFGCWFFFRLTDVYKRNGTVAVDVHCRRPSADSVVALASLTDADSCRAGTRETVVCA